MTAVNVGLNRAVKNGRRNTIEHRNVKITVFAPWGSEDLHQEVKELVGRWYPEWSISGFANPDGRPNAGESQ
jgi:hypothetical protein